VTVWDWKTKQKLAAMKAAKEEADAAARKAEAATTKDDILWLDENIKEGQIEAMWDKLDREEQEPDPKAEWRAKRKLIKVRACGAFSYSRTFVMVLMGTS
jgi:hypothetical protein